MRTPERKQLTRDLFIYYKGFQKLRVTLQRLQRDLKKTDISKVCQLQRASKTHQKLYQIVDKPRRFVRITFPIFICQQNLSIPVSMIGLMNVL